MDVTGANLTNSLMAENETKAKNPAEHKLDSLRDHDAQVTSSDDDFMDEQVVPADGLTALGVSIGREQARLASATTPAAERAAVIEEAGGFFAPVMDGESEDPSSRPEVADSPQPIQQSTIGSAAAEPLKAGHEQGGPGPQSDARSELPSPWRPGPVRRRSRTSFLGALLSHRRSRSGSELTLPTAERRKGSDGAGSGAHSPKRNVIHSKSGPRDVDHVHGRTGRRLQDRTHPFSQSTPLDGHTEADATTNFQCTTQSQKTYPGGQRLERSASDDNLTLTRTLSMVPSLGDDTRFENVQNMVNSRAKAIRDTWRESRFGKHSFKPDFLRDRKEVKEGTEKPMDPMTFQPHQSMKQAAADAGTAKPSTHPQLKRAMHFLEGDVVILGGYRGSVLRSAQPPHRELWIPVKAGLNLRKVDLELGIAPEDDMKPDDKIIPDGMLTHIGPVDISRRLFKRLQTCENAQKGKLRVHDYGYDWRLDPNFLSRQFIEFLEKLPANREGVRREERGATVIAHSLGGLITRHAINQRPELFNGVVYAGTPNHCVNILGPLRNGDDVLLSSRILTAQVNFTIRTSFALLPLDGRCFIDMDTKEEYPVDFFDPQSWLEYRLSPCVARPLPPLTVPEKPTGLSSYVNHVANALPSLPIHKRKDRTANAITEPTAPSNTTNSSAVLKANNLDPSSTTAPPSHHPAQNDSVATAVTLDPPAALAYLTRILPSIKSFKLALAHNPSHAASNSYPPLAVIYGKSLPTVYGAKVRGGREGIKRADAYDNLAFASGDGVVLARAAMVPEGYQVVRGGVVSSERGHVTLLGDLEAVGKALLAVVEGRRKGVGLGLGGEEGRSR